MPILNTTMGTSGGGGGGAQFYSYPASNAEAQDIVDAIENGNQVFILKDNMSYSYKKTIAGTDDYTYFFVGMDNFVEGTSETTLTKYYITIITDSNKDVTSYLAVSGTDKYLNTNVDYSTPYMPTYDGSPATKAYVDMKTSGLAPYNLKTVDTQELAINITWHDPDDPAVYPAVTRQSSVLVRKTGDYPTSPSDGTVVLTETTRNNYMETAYIDEDVTRDTTYYYRVFSLFSDNNYYYTSSSATATLYNPFRFVAVDPNSTVKLATIGNPTIYQFEYSLDGTNWNNYTLGDTITVINTGDEIYFRNASNGNTRFTGYYTDYYQFQMTGSFDIKGGIEYLLNKDGTPFSALKYMFFKLFYGCSAIRNVSSLLLRSVTGIGDYCYSEMFHGCTNLQNTPKLPATTIGAFSYQKMFSGCTSLTTAPDLPATTLGRYSYKEMFSGCTSLTTAPDLPATSVPEQSYYYMFAWCSNLTMLPKIYATTFGDSSCLRMFIGCSKIKLSTTQTGEYQTEYRIPFSGTASSIGENAFLFMFEQTGGTFQGSLTANTAYYTSNTIV